MEEPLEKKFYKIKDVADMIGVPQSTLRFWESEFPELSPMRSSKKIRYYTTDDIETVKIINYLVKTRGLRLEAAKKELSGNKKNVSKRLRIIDKLTDIRNELQGILGGLEKRRDCSAARHIWLTPGYEWAPRFEL